MKKKKAGKRNRSTPFLRSTSWKKMREEILERDGHKCALCGCDENIAVHHIIYRKEAKELKLEPLNLITLCPSCHYRVHKFSWNFILSQWLADNRPEQFEFVMQWLNACLGLK